MNREIKNKIYTTINQLHDELDKSYELKKELNFDTEFPELITNETRIKIIKEFIEIYKLAKEIYKLAKKNTKDKLILERMSNITKKCKLHFSQLKRLKTENYEDNVKYFTILLRVLFSLSTHHLACGASSPLLSTSH
jgi:metal-dependent amidase/aminoacylase/carboxypeptidase family protein